MSGSIAVTGSKGFVGGHLLARLGARAIALDADVTDADALAESVAAASAESVVHLAAASSVAASWTDAGEPWRVNALGTVNLLDAVRSHTPGARVLIVSTGDVYGQADEIPTPETAPFRPISPYAASKAAAELAADQFARAGSDVVVARAFQHEGPGRTNALPSARGPPRSRVRRKPGAERCSSATSSPRRDITDVRDVVRAYEAPARPVRPGRDLQRGVRARGRDARGARASSCRSRRCPIEVEEDPSRFRASEVTVLCGDASKLRAATGWAPTIPLEQTLADALDAARAAVAERMASA